MTSQENITTNYTTQIPSLASPNCTFSYPDVSPTTRYVAGIGFAICGFLAAFGNTISLLVIVTRRKMRRSKSNKVIASLAMSDALVGYVLCPLISTQLLSESWRHSCLVEMIKNLGGPMMVGTSAFTVALIGYDRYISLSNSLNYEARLTTRTINALILLIWTFQGVLFATIFVHRALYLAVLAIFLILPFVVISVSYYLVVRYVRLNSFPSMDNVLGSGESTPNIYGNVSNEGSRNAKNRKMVHRFKVLVVCYLVCLAPLAVNLLLEFLVRITKQPKSVGHQTLTVFASLAAMCNSVVNPLIYVFKYPDFKEEMMKMLCFRRTKNNKLATRTIIAASPTASTSSREYEPNSSTAT